MPDERPAQHRRYLIIVIVATLFVFAPLVTADFSSWDDGYNIWMNPRLNPPTLRGIAHYWTNAEFGLYMPLTYTVWGALAKISYLEQADALGAHLNPWVFHSANVLFHTISAAVVFAILELLVRDRRASCVGALLFALHPVQVEPVAWCAGMKDVLSGMLGLMAIWQYVLYARGAGADRNTNLELSAAGDPIRGGAALCPGVGRHYLVATVCFIFAMLAKPSAMVVPLILVAIDTLLLRRSIRTVLRSLAPWVILSIACAVLTKLNQPGIGVTPAPLWARPLIALDSVAFYLYKLVWPVSLGIDYGRRPRDIIADGRIWFTWIVPVILAMGLILNRKRCRELLVAGIIFVLGVAPVLGLVTFLFQQFSTTADHYLYLAMLGVALAGAWVAQRLMGAGWIRVAWIVLAALGARSMLQTRVWQNDVRLFEQALAVNPRSFLAAGNLAHVVSARESDRAEKLYRHALELNEHHLDARENLAALLESKGRIGEAIEHRQIALAQRLARPAQIRGNVLEKRVYLINDLIEVRRLDEAREQLEIARSEAGDSVAITKLLNDFEQKLRRSATAPADGR